jgi:hypothetical protein
MSKGKIVEPELLDNTQKEQNAFVSEKVGHTPGSEQTSSAHPVEVRPTLSETREPGDPQQEFAGREEGGPRWPRAANAPGSTMQHRNTEPEQQANQGALASRTPEGASQGISNAASADDNARQHKVVDHRPDAESGVNVQKKSA